MILENIKKIINKNSFDDVKLTGITCVEDGIAEFIPDMRYMYFDFNDRIIEFESIEQYSKLRISIVDNIIHEPGFEDVIPSSMNISRIVFTNHLSDNKVKGICFFNLEEEQTELICDAVHIKLLNGQDMFLDPQFIGINIGGIEQKEFWLDNILEGVTLEEMRVEFNDGK